MSLIRKFWFYFSPKHFLIGDTATTQVVVITITGFHSNFGRVSVFTAMMQEKFCFGKVRVSVFVRFAFARLGSAPLGSGRLGAREGSSRDYMYKKIRHGRALKWYLVPWRNL